MVKINSFSFVKMLPILSLCLLLYSPVRSDLYLGDSDLVSHTVTDWSMGTRALPSDGGVGSCFSLAAAGSSRAETQWGFWRQTETSWGRLWPRWCHISRQGSVERFRDTHRLLLYLLIPVYNGGICVRVFLLKKHENQIMAKIQEDIPHLSRELVCHSCSSSSRNSKQRLEERKQTNKYTRRRRNISPQKQNTDSALLAFNLQQNKSIIFQIKMY